MARKMLSHLHTAATLLASALARPIPNTVNKRAADVPMQTQYGPPGSSDQLRRSKDLATQVRQARFHEAKHIAAIGVNRKLTRFLEALPRSCKSSYRV
jgi:hypothetical protein